MNRKTFTDDYKVYRVKDLFDFVPNSNSVSTSEASVHGKFLLFSGAKKPKKIDKWNYCLSKAVLIATVAKGSAGEVIHFVENKKFCTTNNLRILIVKKQKENLINSKYFYFFSMYFLLPFIKKEFGIQSTAQITINSAQIKAFPIFVPDLKVQNEIVEFLENLNDWKDKQIKSIKQAKATIKIFFDKLMSLLTEGQDWIKNKKIFEKIKEEVRKQNPEISDCELLNLFDEKNIKKFRTKDLFDFVPNSNSINSSDASQDGKYLLFSGSKIIKKSNKFNYEIKDLVLIVVSGAGAGRIVNYVKNERIAVTHHLKILKPKNKFISLLDLNYFVECARKNLFKFIESYFGIQPTATPTINSLHIKSFEIYVYKLKIQNSIVFFIEKKQKIYQELIEKINQQEKNIEKLVVSANKELFNLKMSVSELKEKILLKIRDFN